MSEQDTSSTLDTVDKLLSQAKNLLEKKNENLDIAATLMLVQAANMGSLEAKTLIGDLTFYGRCVDKSLVEAVRWYGSAAEQGYKGLVTVGKHGFLVWGPPHWSR